MQEPPASRPYMPGYGILGPTEGPGLLPWSWAEQRLAGSHDYWVATRWPDGRPHLMPVWGVWQDTSIWFSSSGRSRKTRNLAADPRCSVTTDNPLEPVVVEGVARLVTDPAALTGVLEDMNRKYATSYTIELLDPAVNACFQVRPRWVFSLSSAEFTGSPTRWSFPAPEPST